MGKIWRTIIFLRSLDGRRRLLDRQRPSDFETGEIQLDQLVEQPGGLNTMYMFGVHEYHCTGFQKGGLHSQMDGQVGVDVNVLLESIVSFALLVIYRYMEDPFVYNVHTAVRVGRG